MYQAAGCDHLEYCYCLTTLAVRQDKYEVRITGCNASFQRQTPSAKIPSSICDTSVKRVK